MKGLIALLHLRVALALVVNCRAAMRRAPIAACHERRGGTLTENWYRALEHRTVDVGMESWVLQVVAIYPDGAELWIQVANDDARYERLVLHVSRWTTLPQALAAMEECRDRLDVYPRVISLLPTE